MQKNFVPRMAREVSAIGQGCWQLGADWTDVADDTAQQILDAAADAGVTFYDTADVYGDGRSERAVGAFAARRNDPAMTVATKMGRRADPHEAAEYNLDNYRRWTDRSRENLGVETLDLVQLHCPPSEVFDDPQTYDDLRTLQQEGRIARWGVSVETCDEALAALREPDLASIQIIVNLFRRKPLEQVLGAARDAGVGIIARVPLASGLLSGKYDEHTTFGEADHRTFNREGKAFDVGETFSGVPFEVGVGAARDVAALTPPDRTTAQMALAWLVQMGVSTVIPGASNPDQARANAAAGSLEGLDDERRAALAKIYNDQIREFVHTRW
ncbi:aldo/keto reductase [Demequina sp. NBRC 110055]|uniref:aldo/keto reductase n=1 Tax=Demequina sp. NBRC 110055 TaxID=1570344 RepID=UPI000A0349D2|nr:aldo/keto reductase [Demequina sp. NBRC 110055]